MLKPAAIAAAALLPTSLTGHPHVFVQAQMAIQINADGQIEGVHLRWFYDDLFSLLLTSDLGIDLDGDMRLEPEEFRALEEAVLNWPSDFEGDLEVRRASGDVVPLGARLDASINFENGRLEERHFRALAAPVAVGEGVAVATFDPYFYVAYALEGPVQIIGNDACRADISEADVDAAYTAASEMLGGRLPSEVPDTEQFPRVGGLFSDQVIVTCPG